MNSQKDFCGWGSTTDPAGGAHNAPPDPLADSWGSAPDPKGYLTALSQTSLPVFPLAKTVSPLAV